ncbi:protein S100-A12-like [Apteryx mantelli]|uniref:Protein S100-A12-like n=1 Tax=Apteryx mantelli TaxID=2696672 RepID=A0A8B7II04_9AVES
MKTDLELALDCAINIYHQYSVKKPLDDYLSRGEFRALLTENAKPFLTNTKPPGLGIDAYIDRLFVKADHNRDGRLKFTEFLTTLNLVAIEAHKRSHQHPNEPGHGQGQGQGHDHSHGHSHDHGHGPQN